MDRPIAMMREILKLWFALRWIERDIEQIRKCNFGELWSEWLFQSLHRFILTELIQHKRQLRRLGVKVVSQRFVGKCIVIEFKYDNKIDQADFPISILKAEAIAEIQSINKKILSQWNLLLKKVSE